MKVLIDTNVLLEIARERSDFAGLVEREYPDAGLCVLKQSLDEIKARKREFFEAVERCLKKNRFQTLQGAGKADDLLFEKAVAEKAVVATNDFLLKKRLKKAGVQVISLKNGRLVL